MGNLEPRIGRGLRGYLPLSAMQRTSPNTSTATLRAPQPSSPAADPVRQSHAEDKRKEMRAGLQDFIKQQRQAAAVAKV